MIELFEPIRTTEKLLNMNLWVLLDVRDSADPVTVIQNDVRTQSEDMGKSNLAPCFKIRSRINIYKKLI